MIYHLHLHCKSIPELIGHWLLGSPHILHHDVFVSYSYVHNTINYNARASYAPDGTKMAMVHSAGNGYQIAVMDLENRAVRVLTTTRLDESPTFAPNGSMILYATVDRGKTTLAAVATDGRIRQELGVQRGKVREPAWSPFKKR